MQGRNTGPTECDGIQEPHRNCAQNAPSRPSEVVSQVNSDCVSEFGRVNPAECKQSSAGARAVHWLFMSDRDTANRGLLEMAR